MDGHSGLVEKSRNMKILLFILIQIQLITYTGKYTIELHPETTKVEVSNNDDLWVYKPENRKFKLAFPRTGIWEVTEYSDKDSLLRHKLIHYKPSKNGAAHNQ